MAKERSQAANQEKACYKEIDKTTTAKALQNLMKSIDSIILVNEVTASLKPGATVAPLT